MNTFSNDSERLEFALTSLRNIADLARKLESHSARPVSDLAEDTVRIIERSQHEPSVEMNDLLLEIHEQQ